jgi:hypothetical protein
MGVEYPGRLHEPKEIELPIRTADEYIGKYMAWLDEEAVEGKQSSVKCLIVQNRPGEFGAGVVDTPPNVSYAILELERVKSEGWDGFRGEGPRTTVNGTGRVTTDNVKIEINDNGTLRIYDRTFRHIGAVGLNLRHCVLYGTRSAQSGMLAELEQEISPGEVVTLTLWG